MAEQGIHDNHRERMRKRFQENGFDSFSEHEVLEYLLFHAIPRKDVNPIAHELIDHFGGLDRVLETDEKELMKVNGIGPSAARLISVILATDRYYRMMKTRPPKTVKNLEEIGNHMEALLYGAKVEMVYAMYLDDRNHILKVEKCFEGTINASTIFVNMITSRMITLGATQIVISHNHPGGLALPSREDMVLTTHLQSKLNTLGLKLLDHVIVAPDGYVSLRMSERFKDIFEP